MEGLFTTPYCKNLYFVYISLATKKILNRLDKTADNQVPNELKMHDGEQINDTSVIEIIYEN